MFEYVASSPRRLIEELGRQCLFFAAVLKTILKGSIPFRWTLDQMYNVGVRSLSTTLFISLFVGAIMAIQIYAQVRDFGAMSYLGGLSTSVTIRNIGPILIAFLLSGKVGAYTSAELGTMKVTDQISAIRCLGADPIRYLIAPRMIAVVLSSFLLLTFGIFMTIVGGAAISELALGVNLLSYLHNIPRLVTGWSIGTGIVKSFVFGCLIGAICCYRGYVTEGGAESVGKTVRTTAVQTLVSLIVADYALSTLSEALHDFLGVGIV
jgi:phospholipid/cholesterol/gamma-HCH transport system permease protein